MDEVESSKQLIATTFFKLVTYRYEALAGASVPETARRIAKKRRSTPEGRRERREGGSGDDSFRKRNEANTKKETG